MADSRINEETDQLENQPQDESANVDDPWHDVFETENISQNLHNLDISSVTVQAGQESTLPYRPAPPGMVSDVRRVHTIHSTAGYRDGISASKEKFIQEGFDEGFLLGAELGFAVGYIQGCLEIIKGAFNNSIDQVYLKRVNEVVERASTELDLKNVFNPQYFDGNGVWKYPVKGNAGGAAYDEEKDELNITLEDAAKAHPIIIRWMKELENISDELKITISE
jgi:Essential protein Yae1, N terminal